ARARVGGAGGEGAPPPAAVLIEMGLKDERPTDWSSRAAVAGAKVVHREGYRFRREDRLTDPGGWKASSHRGLRLPPRNPVTARLEGIATVGVVLHLADVKDDARLTVDPRPGGGGQAAEGAWQAGRPVGRGGPGAADVDGGANQRGPDGGRLPGGLLRPRRHPLGRLRRLPPPGGGAAHRTRAAEGAAGRLQELLHAGVRRPAL